MPTPSGIHVKPRFIDILIIIIAGFVVAGSAVLAFGGRGSARLIIQGRANTWIYPLSTNERLEIPGPLGTTLVSIHDGKAYIESSPCANQTCVTSGKIGAIGQWSACLPNEVFIRIDGQASDNGKPDAIVR